MNYYERIQKSIDFMEENLEEKIKVSDMAREAFMSVSNFHRLFFALTGYSAKEYIRLRRISLAAVEVKTMKKRIIDIAFLYDYDSVDAFSRAFRLVTGFLPSKYSGANIDYVFERINLMEKYFDVQDNELLEMYPDIKVLKELQPMRVAYYCYYGKNPEDNAFLVMSDWIVKNKINLQKGEYRIFGYNAPDSDPTAEEYGYEVCLTIPDEITVLDDNVAEKTLEGGLYAVMGIPRGDCLGENIMKGWQRFNKWIEGSKYVYGCRQWLEEHMGFNEKAEHIGGVDLYMPIMPKSELSNQEELAVVEPMRTVSYTATGKNAVDKARKYIFDWASRNGIHFEDGKHRIFAYYNFDRIGTLDFFYTLHISISDKFEVKDPKLEVGIFEGGMYLLRSTKYQFNAQTWFEFINYVEHNRKYCLGRHWFMEEYLLEEPVINRDTKVALFIPIAIK